MAKAIKKTYTLLGSGLIFIGIFLSLFVISSIIYVAQEDSQTFEDTFIKSRYISSNSALPEYDEGIELGIQVGNIDLSKNGEIELNESRKVIQIEKELSSDEILSLEEKYNITFTHDTSSSGVYVLTTTQDSDIEGLTLDLNTSVETDIPVKMVSDFIDWGILRIGADKVWEDSTGNGILIGIIDTGVQKDHPDLVKNLVKGYDFVNNDDDATDDNGHGTHVAGIASASSNQAGTVGVSPSAKILPIKVLNAQGYGYLSDVVKGIYYATDNGARVINLSLSSPTDSTMLRNAVNYASNKGVLVVAAAGNDSGAPCAYPAAYSSAICVVATDNKNMLASFSNVGGELAAPGVSNYSTYIGSSYRYLSGTSMASPHVAGSAALLMSLCTTCSTFEIRTILRETAIDLGAVGKDILFGYGLVDLTSAVASLQPDENKTPSDTTDINGNPIDTGNGLQEQNMTTNNKEKTSKTISQILEISEPLPTQSSKYIPTTDGDITIKYTLNPIVNETLLEKITLYLDNIELESSVLQSGDFILPYELLDSSQHWVKLVAYFDNNTQSTDQLVIDMTYLGIGQQGGNSSGNSVLGVSISPKLNIFDILRDFFSF